MATRQDDCQGRNVDESVPSQQGLKQRGHDITDRVSRVDESVPSQQGLKPELMATAGDHPNGR